MEHASGLWRAETHITSAGNAEHPNERSPWDKKFRFEIEFERGSVLSSRNCVWGIAHEWILTSTFEWRGGDSASIAYADGDVDTVPVGSPVAGIPMEIVNLLLARESAITKSAKPTRVKFLGTDTFDGVDRFLLKLASNDHLPTTIWFGLPIM